MKKRPPGQEKRMSKSVAHACRADSLAQGGGGAAEISKLREHVKGKRHDPKEHPEFL